MIWLPWDFWSKLPLKSFFVFNTASIHFEDTFRKYTTWVLLIGHLALYMQKNRCQHTRSTLNFEKMERGVKLCTGRNTTCSPCSTTSCVCSTYDMKLLWTAYLLTLKYLQLESMLAFSSADKKLLCEWYIYIVYICIHVYIYVGSHA